MSEAKEVDGKMFQESDYFPIIDQHEAKAVHQKELQKTQHPGARPRAYIQLLQEPEIPFI